MKLSSKVLLFGVCIGVSGSPVSRHPPSYAPLHVTCPSQQWLRPAANGLSPQEEDWVKGRKIVVTDALTDCLTRLKLQDFDVTRFIAAIKDNDHAHVPIMGFLISGGGWTSAFTGTAALRALDDRLEAAKEQKTGGLLQSLTHLSGLSGGSWPVMSLAQYNSPAINKLVKHRHVAADTLSLKNDTQYTIFAKTIFEEMATKARAGFPVSMADFLGRAIGYQFIAGEKEGLTATFSDVVSESSFKTHQMPFPMTQLVELDPSDKEYYGQKVASSGANIYDVTPFKFGAWHGVKFFFPTKYLGSAMHGGSPINDTSCVTGFDRASFIIGSSADAFNMYEIESLSDYTLGGFSKRSSLHGASAPTKELAPIVKAFQKEFGLNISQIAPAYYPNPFAGVASVSPPAARAPFLHLVDGTESLQGLPFWGQIQPARRSNFIIAWDDSTDTVPYIWLNGTTIYNTYRRAKAESIPFPVIPSVNTIINRKYNIRPTFFGCDVKLTTTESADAPIVLYMANAPYSAYANTSYTQSATTESQFSDILVNSFNEVTQGNGTIDSA